MSFHRSVFLSRKTTQHFLGKSAQKVLEKILEKVRKSFRKSF